jgi:hypothetical protein
MQLLAQKTHMLCVSVDGNRPVEHEEDDRSRPGRAWDYAEVFILTKIS